MGGSKISEVSKVSNLGWILKTSLLKTERREKGNLKIKRIMKGS